MGSATPLIPPPSSNEKPGENMLIGCSTFCFPGRSIQDALLLCNQFGELTGYGAVEIGMYPDMVYSGYPSTPWPWEDNQMWGTLADQIKRYQIIGAHFPIQDLNLISSNPNMRAASMDCYKRSIQRSGDLGIHYGVLHLKGERYGLSDADQRTLFVESLAELAAEARINGLVLYIENAVLNGPAVVMLDDLVEVVQTLDSPQVRLLVDLGHANIQVTSESGVKSNVYGSFGSLAKFFDQANEYIAAFHLHGNNGISDQHTPLAKSNMNIRPLQKFLSDDSSSVMILEANFGDDLALAERDWKWLQS
jgi:sugar phosphate isomerase/epimerase